MNTSDPNETQSTGSPSLRMLYVEDNRLNAVLFEEAMRMRGDIELQCFETAAETMAFLQTEPAWVPEFIVLDANLPDGTGYDLLKKLRGQVTLLHTPAFMCSADAYADDLTRAREAGFVGYWTKPLDLTQVNKDIDHWRGAPR
ncbi:MAG: response regulator [Burkholderiaceae bacterium]